MKCYLCNSKEYYFRNGECRDNKKIKICECSNCGLVFLESFKHIDSFFYNENGQVISNKKNNIVNTASLIDTERRYEQFYLKLANKNVLDFGCGKGLFLSKLKEKGISSKLNSLEINKSYESFLSNEFNHFNSIDEIKDDSIDVITLFHVLEHLEDPIKTLNQLYPKLKSGGRIIIEVPSSEDVLLKTYKSSAFSKFTYWSCHLYLFNTYTLKRAIEKTLYEIDYVKQYQRYSLANHLHWLSFDKPAGHVIFSFLDDNQLNSLYSKKLSEIGQCDTVISEIIKK